MSTEVAVKQSVVSIDDWINDIGDRIEIRTVYFKRESRNTNKIRCELSRIRGFEPTLNAAGIGDTSGEAFSKALAKFSMLEKVEAW